MRLLKFFCLVALLLGPAVSSAAKPNVILIMADDMGYECLSCNGSATYETPNLDRLARGGIRFEHCYSQPLCTPSRVKIMTGKYNFRNYEEFGYLNPRERTFGHMMQDAGYRTCIAGKWQLNGIYHDLPNSQDTRRPLQAGFDESCLWQVTRQRSEGERFADPLIERNGEAAERLEDKYGPQVFSDFVCDFIERNKDEPFFVWYPMALTHDPFVPTPDSPEWESGDRYQKDNRFFIDMVAYADKVVGQIDAKLGELGLRENTILMFTGDNGTRSGITAKMIDGSVVKGGKGSTPDAGTHVPFVASWPGHTPSGFVSTDLIDFSDFFATLADVAGAKEEPPGDGRSFFPRLQGKAGNPREFMFCHYDPRWMGASKRKDRFARNQTYKLYLDGRMYNVPADVLEQRTIEPETLDARGARKLLEDVLTSMPPWNPQPERPASLRPRTRK